jgi:putative ABC transport system permease protein
MRFVFGTEGGIAVRQLAARPERAARACGVGFVTVVLVVGFGHTVLNTLADVRAWADRAIPADLLVRGAPPDPGFVLNVPLPESLGDELRSLDGVSGVDRIAFVPTAANGVPILVLARTFAPERPLPLAVRADEAEVLRQGLARGEAVLAESLAATLRVAAGDFVSLDTPRGPRRVCVAGVVAEFAAGGAALYLDWGTAGPLFGPLGVHIFLVSACAERKADAAVAVAHFCAGRGLFLQRDRELRTTVDGLTRGLTAGLWALLAVTAAIAALGVANGVAALAVEQRDDVRRLRAVGMSARRVRRMFRLQAVLLGAAGAPGGALCGVFVALALNRVIQGLWGYRIPFQIQWSVIAWSVGTSIVAALAVGAATRGVTDARS